MPRTHLELHQERFQRTGPVTLSRLHLHQPHLQMRSSDPAGFGSSKPILSIRRLRLGGPSNDRCLAVGVDALIGRSLTSKSVNCTVSPSSSIGTRNLLTISRNLDPSPTTLLVSNCDKPPGRLSQCGLTRMSPRSAGRLSAIAWSSWSGSSPRDLQETYGLVDVQ